MGREASPDDNTAAYFSFPKVRVRMISSEPSSSTTCQRSRASRQLYGDRLFCRDDCAHLPDAFCLERGEKVGFGRVVGIVALKLEFFAQLCTQRGCVARKSISQLARVVPPQ